eukprot:1755418-Alexandrium_andersonii.AAC.1
MAWAATVFATRAVCERAMRMLHTDGGKSAGTARTVGYARTAIWQYGVICSTVARIMQHISCIFP